MSMGCAIEYWITDYVFLTREEAVEYGKARSYNYKKWRVFCVPCIGELADLLDKYDGDKEVLDVE